LGSNSDLVVVTGNLALDGTLNVSNAGGLAAGSYPLFTYGTLQDNTLNVNNPLPGGFSGTVSNDAGTSRILLIVTAGAPNDPFVTWQFQYFGCTNCVQANAATDFDGDGLSNTNEFLAGTNPTNSASSFRVLGVTRNSGNSTCLVTWQSVGGIRYRVQYTDGTANGGYTNAFIDIVRTAPEETDPNPAGTPGAMTYTNAITSSNRYYRVRLFN
jgi:hypothetical protein